MLRVLRPEILDSLPHDDVEAVHSRRDLRLINRIMGNHSWIQSAANEFKHADYSYAELGAGSGELGQLLEKDVANYAGVDRCPRPTGWPASWAWHQHDLLEWNGYPQYNAFIGNLIFHHFTDEQLMRLGEKLRATARLIIACETARRRIHQWQAKLLWPLGINRVTRHDAHVSIAAGFCGHELPALFRLDEATWDVRVQMTGTGAYRMVAHRR